MRIRIAQNRIAQSHQSIKDKMDSGYVAVGTSSDPNLSPDPPRSRKSRTDSMCAEDGVVKFEATYLGTGLVPKNSINTRVVFRKVDAVLDSRKEPSDIVLAIADIQLSMLCEARDIIMPCRRIKGCLTQRHKGALLLCMLEEVRQGQFFCHVIEFRDPREGQRAHALVSDRIAGNKLLL
ncbi:hypothetical protein SARC_05857 [Sphaeroforma arctica JP610]|uniref:PID domain-containing protein n=1 Tax=Sphaeroforma arctica JP610 TaxID=667725 RepID=A0A0L0FYC3_9EUKA|nr:hypothetical protein SARC_05857 [Sphaeroforma arctica JP610]KNC81837.1 hypothetical protein SARC_05857 [Sphaeroforma arctica JP610]|eukprot:XP_014155739.1 hypothetical protein SARC_05857 [Sphaeroforma arctica JP610]